MPIVCDEFRTKFGPIREEARSCLGPGEAVELLPSRCTLKKTDGVLGDVAPTVLAVMGIEQPDAMTGASLLKV